jgi:hypothetical protein
MENLDKTLSYPSSQIEFEAVQKRIAIGYALIQFLALKENQDRLHKIS